jgi:Asp-tRNA(Asn)/Glu-tRNA(Gln) amidotransferase A subunit family amidase
MGDTPLTTLHIAVLRATLDGPMPDGDPDALAKAMRDLIARDLVAAETGIPTDAGIAALELVDATNRNWDARIAPALKMLREERQAYFDCAIVRDDPATLDDDDRAFIAEFDQVIAALEALGAEVVG